MSNLREAKKFANLTFKWGNKKGVGQENKDTQFYESFTYEGTEYSLYDCVYVYHSDISETSIGKLVKLYETASHKKKVKIVWFFRPIDIRNFLGDYEPCWNEIFLASGEGKGLSDINPLETIIEKCNVVCASKDRRNPQASEAELRLADYIFYRTFDVGKLKIVDSFANAIDGIKVDHFFNRTWDRNTNKSLKLHSGIRDRNGKFGLSLKLGMEKGVGVAMKGGNCLSKSTPVVKDKTPDVQPSKKRKPLDETALNKSDKVNPQLGQNWGSKTAGQYVEVTRRLDSTAAVIKKEFSPNTLLRSETLGDKDENQPARISGEVVGTKTKMRVSTICLSEKTPDVQPSKKRKPLGETASKKSDKVNPQLAQNWGTRTAGQFVEVTKRPDDRRNWFKQLPWEERLERAYELGTLVSLKNLDPTYTSSEVEDLVWHAFNEKVEAMMTPYSTCSGSVYGKALVIFNSKHVAETALNKLSRGCLMLMGGRTIFGCRGTLCEPGKPANFIGHLRIAKSRFQRQREEMRNAVSTSHASQPNTIEYDMAMDWRVLQAKLDIWWTALHQQQAKEIQYLRSKLMMNKNG